MTPNLPLRQDKRGSLQIAYGLSRLVRMTNFFAGNLLRVLSVTGLANPIAPPTQSCQTFSIHWNLREGENMNQIDLSGRVAVVTGAARGIGLAIAQRLLQSGASVSAWDFDPAALRSACEQLGSLGKIVAEVVDVTNEAAVIQAARATAERFGKIDILVNNAGIGGPIAQTWDYDVEQFRKVMEVNVVGVFLGCKHVVPIMRRQNWGRIVNIASIAGKNGTPNFAAYGASKAAVIALTKALGRELADTEILVNAVCPSVAETEILSTFTAEKVKWMVEQVPKARFVQPNEIAAMVAWLSSEDCSFSTGQLFDISGGRSVY